MDKQDVRGKVSAQNPQDPQDPQDYILSTKEIVYFDFGFPRKGFSM